jgi:hypothetical protein
VSRTGQGAAKALIERLGLDGFAERVGVKVATVKRWLRDGLPASRQEDVDGAYARSERARKAAIKGAETRRLRKSREEIFREHNLLYPNGEPIDGHTAGTHAVLTQMLHRSDPAWLAFLELAEAEGRSERDAKREWYSPTTKKKPRKSPRKPKIGGRNKGRKKKGRNKGRKK